MTWLAGLTRYLPIKKDKQRLRLAALARTTYPSITPVYRLMTWLAGLTRYLPIKKDKQRLRLAALARTTYPSITPSMG